jgi:hypothetical protein
MTPKGKAVYPHLVEPDTKFDPEGVYKVDLSIPADEAAPLVEQLEAIRDEYVEKTLDEAEGKKKAALKKFTVADVFDEEVDDEGEETGNLIFHFKLKAHVETKSGKSFDQAPRIVDAKNNKFPEDKNIWGGSILRVAGEVFPYAMAATKEFGLSLRCKHIQVIELVEGGSGSSPFDEVDGGFEVEDGGTDAPFEAEEDDDPDF